jgi:Tfp pilus assembly protein PilE
MHLIGKPSWHAKSRSFTLVEMLVALAVLFILALIIVQITSVTNQTIRLSNHLIDSSSQARLACDRVGADLAGLVKRTDIDFLAQNPPATATDQRILSFFSTVSSAGLPSANSRDVSLITYQMVAQPDNNNLTCLARAGMPVAWTNNAGSSPAGVATGFLGLTNGIPLALSYPPAIPSALIPTTTSPSNFDTLAPGVIRLAVGFQLYPDNNSVTLQDGSTFNNSPNAQGQIVFSPPIRSLTPTGGGSAVQYIDITRISAIVVCVVAVDLKSVTLLNNTQVTKLGSVFTTPTNNVPPLEQWFPIANGATTNATLSSIPLPVRQAVQVSQRFYPIYPFPTPQ